jgi:hypothetical protein
MSYDIVLQYMVQILDEYDDGMGLSQYDVERFVKEGFPSLTSAQLLQVINYGVSVGTLILPIGNSGPIALRQNVTAILRATSSDYEEISTIAERIFQTNPQLNTVDMFLLLLRKLEMAQYHGYIITDGDLRISRSPNLILD